MNWKSPELFYAVWVPVIIGALLAIAHRRRLATAERFADKSMLLRLMPTLSSVRPWIKGGLIVAALVLLIIAAARPRYGTYYDCLLYTSDAADE